MCGSLVDCGPTHIGIGNREADGAKGWQDKKNLLMGWSGLNGCWSGFRWGPRAPAGRCKVVHLHPLDFAFQCFAEQYLCAVSDADTPSISFLQSEIQQHVLEFHKETLDIYALQPLTSHWVCTPPPEKKSCMLRTKMEDEYWIDIVKPMTSTSL